MGKIKKKKEISITFYYTETYKISAKNFDKAFKKARKKLIKQIKKQDFIDYKPVKFSEMSVWTDLEKTFYGKNKKQIKGAVMVQNKKKEDLNL